MKLPAVLIFLFISALCYGQRLEAWLTKEAEQNPQAYLVSAKNNVSPTPIEAAGKLFVVGKCYEYLNRENIALKYYLLSKQNFEKLKLTEPAKELAFEIHCLISSQENYKKYSNSFFMEYYTYAQKTESGEKLAKCFNEKGKDAIDRYDQTNNIQELDSAVSYFAKGLRFSEKGYNAQIKSQLYNNLSISSIKQGNFKLARDYLNRSKKYALQTGDVFNLFSNNFNYGLTYFLEENYLQAVIWFKKAETIKIPKYKAKSTRLLYKKLMESYDALNDQPNRRTYQKLYLDLEKKINDEAQNIAIHDLDIRYEVALKDKKISALSKFKDKLEQHKIIFGTLLFIVFLLALYSFVRWKKVDINKKKLETEKQMVHAEKLEIEEKHTKTVAELEKVKSIVIQDYITLKDKTKIYLSDLMYIKAEDHYLNACTTDGKKHFVRGKLGQLMVELPPNFVKCHRSFIVNTNYIQATHSGHVVLKNKDEIPVSRGFKWS